LKVLLDSTKFKNRIYTIIRRSQGTQKDKVEDLSPCPISNEFIPEMDLECPTTKQSIPMCICTGKHMITDDWSFCPISGLPALFSRYLQFIKYESIKSTDDTHTSDIYALDPICGKNICLSQVKQATSDEVQEYLRSFNISKDGKISTD